MMWGIKNRLDNTDLTPHENEGGPDDNYIRMEMPFNSLMTEFFEGSTALQIRAGQLSITTNLWPLTAHIYHVMIIVTRGFPKKSFFIIIFRSSPTQMFFKVLLEILQHQQENIYVGVFFNKGAGHKVSSQKRLQHRWFLRKLQNFYEQLLQWNTSSGCFCQFDKITVQ